MLNQLSLTPLEIISSFGSNIVSIAFHVVILIFAILIFKRNSYKYGIMLMLSAIFSLVSGIIFIGIQYPYLSYILYIEMGLPISVAEVIIRTWGLVLLGINTTSLIFLVVAIFMIYKTHKRA